MKHTSQDNTSLSVSVITDIPELRALEPEWNNLLKRSSTQQMFLTWEWVVSWLDAIENKITPYTVTVRDTDGRLCGLAPFYFWRYDLLKFPIDVLRPLADHATGLMYPSWIIDEDNSTAISTAIATELANRRKDFDLIWMPRMASWNPGVDYIEKGFQHTGLTVRKRPTSYSAIQLPSTTDEYRGILSKSVAKNLRWRLNKIRKSEGAIVECNNTTDVDQFMHALFDLHGKRWRQKGEAGVFVRRPLEKRFYEEYLPKAASTGWLRLKAIKSSNTFKAIKLGYAYDNTLLSVQGGYDPDYISGAANVLLFDVICGAIEEGLEVYDFLNTHTNHKNQWRGEERFGIDLYVTSNSLISKAISQLGIWPTGRYLRPIEIQT
ncbi:MAG: GNAT family N-acetyltransferase [Candidatus Thiodiazotropha sp. (ex Monitilora ramsayi)]|nr:GNAT family N-acetyltransferase [Candidatus Thiodiazotropha sp. (ex Monitilora ramsayi)]